MIVSLLLGFTAGAIGTLAIRALRWPRRDADIPGLKWIEKRLPTEISTERRIVLATILDFTYGSLMGTVFVSSLLVAKAWFQLDLTQWLIDERITLLPNSLCWSVIVMTLIALFMLRPIARLSWAEIGKFKGIVLERARSGLLEHFICGMVMWAVLVSVQGTLWT